MKLPHPQFARNGGPAPGAPLPADPPAPHVRAEAVRAAAGVLGLPPELVDVFLTPPPGRPALIPAPFDPDADRAEADLVRCFVALRDAARSAKLFHDWLAPRAEDETPHGVICPAGIANDASGLPWVLNLVAGSIEVELPPRVSDDAVGAADDLPPFDLPPGVSQRAALAALLAELRRCAAVCGDVADCYRVYAPEWDSGRASGPWWAARHVAYLDGAVWAISVATCVWDGECCDDDKDAAAERTAARHAPAGEVPA